MSRCRMAECKNKAFKNGLCQKHYELKQQNKCIVDGCDGEYGTRGMCAKHYACWQRHGDPTIVKQVQIHGLEIKDRLYARTKATNNGSSAKYKYCLEWTGSKDKNGYGRMRINDKPILVHRIAWEIHNGPIPEGRHILHYCDNPSCIRIDHLFLGDALANSQDCIQKGRDHKRGLRGENHNLAKLTENQVMEIRASSERGKTLAERHGVTQTTISEIRKGHSWGHLPILNKRVHGLAEVDVIAIRHSSEGSNVLAKRYGVSRRTIDDARYGRSWEYLPDARNIKEMSFHGKKFTPEDVLHIRTSDESSKILAAKYEVDKSSIDNIRSRRTWANIQ